MRKLIEEYLLELISQGDKYVNTPLPSENFIATKFKCSRQTARVELNRLLNKGFIRSVKGSGYYVNPFMNTLKLTRIGNRFKYLRKEVVQIPSNNLIKIIESSGFNVILDSKDYYGFRKIYFDENNKPAIYQNSYIFQSNFKEINLNLIKKSLMDFLEYHDVSLNMQINNLLMVETNQEDKEILQTQQEWTPVVRGMLVDKDNKVIEIFERKYTIKEFNLSYAKLY